MNGKFAAGNLVSEGGSFISQTEIQNSDF